MGIGWPQILVVVLLIVLLFGRGKISEVMGDFAKGIKSFKRGLNDDPDDGKAPAATKELEGPSSESIKANASSRDNVHVG